MDLEIEPGTFNADVNMYMHSLEIVRIEQCEKDTTPILPIDYNVVVKFSANKIHRTSILQAL